MSKLYFPITKHNKSGIKTTIDYFETVTFGEGDKAEEKKHISGTPGACDCPFLTWIKSNQCEGAFMTIKVNNKMFG